MATQATFQAMLVRSCRAASRSYKASNACNTITEAITSAGTDGRRPFPFGAISAGRG